MKNTQPQHWAVIGGGMLGMTLAYRLMQRGERVTLCEAAPQLGGLVSAWSLGDVVWDRYYHVTLMSDTRLRALLEEIGLEREMRWVETKTGFFAGGKLYSMSNAIEFLKFPPLNMWERLRLGGTIFLASKLRNWRRLEKIPVADWLQRWSGRGAFEKIWQPLLRAKLGEAYKKTSAAFIWAHTQRMYKARQSGQKKEMFGYVPGGYARILDRMAEVLEQNGVEIRCNAAVEHVSSAAGEPVAVRFHNGEEDKFDRIVFTTPAGIISRACPQLSDSERERFEGIEYLGIVCSSLLLKKPLSPYYVTNIIDGWVPLTAVIEMTTIVDPADLGGHSLVYLPKYMMSDDEGFNETDDQIRERCLSTLEKMYPNFSRDDVLAFRVGRARCVMALPTLSYSERLPPMETSIPGVFAVNSSHILKGNLNVNETIQMAEESIEGVLAPAIVAGPRSPTVRVAEEAIAKTAGPIAVERTPKPIASLSLDLDNKWAYLRTLGVDDWKTYPSYLNAVVPRILKFCDERKLQMTCFVVGRDAEQPQNRDALNALAARHEIANHSHNHYPWMHGLDREEVEAEICEAEEQIERATGRRPIGFRGPGYSLSNDVLEILAARGYHYDATSLPTYIGPLARWYVRRAATPEAAARASRKGLFGTWRDGWKPLKPYVWQTSSGPLAEIPVTTFPVIRMPIHMTYLMHLWRISPRLTKAYLRSALAVCHWRGVSPSILLHPIDFLGAEDEPDLRCLPGMTVPLSQKLELLDYLMTSLAARFELVPMCEHAELVGRQFGIARRRAAPISEVAEPMRVG